MAVTGRLGGRAREGRGKLLREIGMELKQLSREEMQRIDEASLDVLSTVGVLVPHPETLRRFAEAGAHVDMEKELVKIPAELVKKYERLFEARDNLAVSAVEGVTCTGCYTSIQPNLLVKLQASSCVVQCSSCERILFLPE